MGLGINEKGFAIVNSDAADLPGDGPNNLVLMYMVLGKYATVEEFEHYLDSTNITGRNGISSNYAVIDTTGAAAIYETTDNEYWKFDVNDLEQAPDGYLVRTNFTVNGGGDVGLPNYNRSVQLIGDIIKGDSLNYRNVLRYQMRDFSDVESNPLPVPYQGICDTDIPYGYIDTWVSICRFYNVSAAVIHGVLPGESGKLSTMWTMLCDPATTIAIPLWPVCSTPEAVNKPLVTPLSKVPNAIHSYVYSDTLPYPEYLDSYKLIDESGGGLWAMIFPAEDSIFNATELLLDKWRNDTMIVEEVSATEISLAEYALSKLQSYYDEVITTNDQNLAVHNLDGYPNPTKTTFTLDLSTPIKGELEIHNLNGQLIYSRPITSTIEQIDMTPFPKGIYFITVRSDAWVRTEKVVLE